MPTLAVSTRVEHIIFFDGGSRGNPGPGGSGTVILQTTASMSYRRASMTNNQAGYLGLLHGLGYAWAARFQSVHVVGDSQLIIQQMRDRRTPKAEVLRTLYLRCQLLADERGVETWIHHYREFNRMADSHSNLAMDTTHSRQTRLPVHGEPNGRLSALF
ncbi:Ribonuclease H [Phytophthora megakarya]|uniref:Ribonuclease H n=1 Tax=Phytophthora megakarya TaxID=4795 RepID=A0A225W3W2_9STRA|nr:Ribonuclease H [Phytophthora megakarya]